VKKLKLHKTGPKVKEDFVTSNWTCMTRTVRIHIQLYSAHVLLASFFEISGAISVLYLQHSYAQTTITLQDVPSEDSWLEPKVLKCFYAA
jgi:uncharacterized integral membrane protein